MQQVPDSDLSQQNPTPSENSPEVSALSSDDSKRALAFQTMNSR
jgi:hypothetical protein